jgi:hypothetical protein
MSDAKKRGFSWNDRINHDVHNLRGMECSDCHQAIDKEHNFAKGNENVSTVRDDLDNTMKNCQQCHTEGYMGAPRPKHLSIRPNHLEKLSCETATSRPCTWPRRDFDVTTGRMVNYPKSGPEDRDTSPEAQLSEGRKEGLRGEKISPVNPLWRSFYTNGIRTASTIRCSAGKSARATARSRIAPGQSQ